MMPVAMEDYSLVKQIGKGSYGKVWLIKKNHSNKQYVLKQIDMQNASKQEQCSAYIEVKLLSSLKHPNIVSYYNSFQKPNDILHIIMGYCENGDMYTYIRSRKGLLFPEKQIVEWFVQICMALQYLHERNILHRDLKTQNIFLTKTKIIKIGDLGIARILDSTCDLATTLIGTPYYMSPELFANQPYNHKSDVWALGCCVYEMTTLKHAFNARDLNSLMYKVLLGKLPTMPKQYSTGLVDLMCLMLSYDATCRPTVKCILQNDYMRKHIMDFLKETNNRCKKTPNRYEKCSPSVPNFPVHRNAKDASTQKHSPIQSKLSSPVVSKDLESPVIQETRENLKSEYAKTNNPSSSRTQLSVANGKFQEVKIENCVNEKAQFLLDKKINKSVDALEDFPKNFTSKYSSSSNTNTTVKQINDKASITHNKNISSHYDNAQNSEKEKVKTTPPRRRRRQKWQRARSEGDTTSNCYNSCNSCNNCRKNISARPLPAIPSQLSIHSLEDVTVTFCKNTHRPDFQQNKCAAEQGKLLPVAVTSQDNHIISKNSEARRRRREKLLQQQQVPIEHAVLSTSKIHEDSVANEGMVNHDQFCYAVREGMENNEEKIDTEFQEFIGILDSTLQMKDKCNEKQQHLTSEKVDKECKNKISETTANENQACLIQRRDLLIKDCSLALGDSLLRKVLDAIDYTISDADLQSRLLYLLGKKHLDTYGGQIIQLKMYENAVAAR